MDWILLKNKYKTIFLKTASEWIKPRTVFAFMFYSTACYLVLMKIEIPQFLNTIISSLMGFYYGQKVPQQIKGKE